MCYVLNSATPQNPPGQPQPPAISPRGALLCQEPVYPQILLGAAGGLRHKPNQPRPGIENPGAKGWGGPQEWGSSQGGQGTKMRVAEQAPCWQEPH